MPEPPLSESDKPPASGVPPDPRWLRNVRIAALAALLLYTVSLVGLVGCRYQSYCFLVAWFAFSLALPVFVCYPRILWLLRSGPTNRGLSLAIGTGTGVFVASAPTMGLLAAWSVISSGKAIEGIEDRPFAFTFLAFTALWLYTHFGLWRNAKKMYGVLWPRESFWQAHLGGTLLIVGYLVAGGFLFAWGAAGLFPSRITANQASAVGSLRTLNTAIATYESTYGTLPPTIESLGPDPAGHEASALHAGLIDEVLASGHKSGYAFTYQVTARGEKVHPRSYTIKANPIQGCGTGNGNCYFTDETEVIRFTTEDRPATAADSPLSG